MSDAKTRPTQQDVGGFLAQIADPQQRADCQALCALLSEEAGAEPQLWGSSIVGFGSYHYRYASGREGDWPLVGLSPRKGSTTVYLCPGLEQHSDLLARLGKHTIGKGCLYIKRLSEIDQAALRELVQRAVAQQRAADTSAQR